MRPHDSVTLFTDRCLGCNDVPTALRQAGLLVEIHKAHFNSDAADEEWIPAVGQRGWIALTKDKSLRSRQSLVAAVLKSNTAVFVLTSASTTGSQNVAAFIAAIPDLLELCARFPKPFLAQVTGAGKVSITLSHQGLIDQHAKLSHPKSPVP
jgi:hypothetical protein